VNQKKEQLKGIVGEGNVYGDPKVLMAHARDQSLALTMRPSFVVKPQSAQVIQELVKWANKTETALVPVSSGPPHIHGGTIPTAAGAVVVDLCKMDKIIRIDRRNRIAIIEPGVTYNQLQPELARAGLRLSTPLLPRANKSVVAGLLEREPTLVPKYQWAMLDPLRCVEVVWGDGELFTTGEVPRPGSLEAEWKAGMGQAVATGPAQADYYKLVSAAQGSMGIVTWASVKCEVLPAVHELFFVPAQELNDLIDLTYKLLRFRFGDEIVLLNRASLAAAIADSAEQLKSFNQKLPPWILLVGVAGRHVLPQERVAFQQKDISDMADQCGLQLESTLAGINSQDLLKVLLNPSKNGDWKSAYQGGHREIFFLSTLDKTPGFIQTLSLLAQSSGYPTSNIGVYLQPVHQGASCHCEFSLPFERDKPDEAQRMRALFTQASEKLLQQGAYFSRPYGAWANMAFNRDAQTTAVLKKVKKIFDPNNVMNPGKLCF
jgi:FAD/FMN-containing dehydrogenase